MAMEIVDLPIKDADFLWLFKRLPGRVVPNMVCQNPGTQIPRYPKVELMDGYSSKYGSNRFLPIRILLQ
jgi:hypothetical protein